MKYVGKTLTFDDIALVPQYNNIESRLEPNTETWLTTETKLQIPLLAANMDTVISEELADVLIANGTFPIFHRFAIEEKLIDLAEKYKDKCYMSIGLNESQALIHTYDEIGVRGLNIDVAHGHDKRVLELIKELKENYDFEIIAGNVCTAGGYIDLVQAGADAVKVGIGPGAACTTRTTTGFGVSQFTSIMNCAEQASKYSVPIIADGGIRNSADIAKALAAGACSVMMGKMFALTEESAAEKRDQPDHFTSIYTGITKEAKYRGQASKDFQVSFKGGLKKGTVPEGESFWAPVTGSAQALIDELIGGLRSAMTYGGARSISEFQRKAEFVEVTNTYQTEANIRKS